MLKRFSTIALNIKIVKEMPKEVKETKEVKEVLKYPVKYRLKKVKIRRRQAFTKFVYKIS